jgi:hypothetical protein
MTDQLLLAAVLLPMDRHLQQESTEDRTTRVQCACWRRAIVKVPV